VSTRVVDLLIRVTRQTRGEFSALADQLRGIDRAALATSAALNAQVAVADRISERFRNVATGVGAARTNLIIAGLNARNLRVELERLAQVNPSPRILDAVNRVTRLEQTARGLQRVGEQARQSQAFAAASSALVPATRAAQQAFTDASKSLADYDQNILTAGNRVVDLHNRLRDLASQPGAPPAVVEAATRAGAINQRSARTYEVAVGRRNQATLLEAAATGPIAQLSNMRATLAAVAAGTTPAATGLHLVDASIKAVASDLARLASAPDASAAIVRAAQQATRIQQHVAGLREGESRVGPRAAVATALAPRIPEVAALQSRLQDIGSGTAPAATGFRAAATEGRALSASMTALVASLAAPPPALVRASQSVGAMATRLEHLARASRAPTQGMVAFREEVGRSAQVLQRQALALDAVAAAMTKSSRNASLSSTVRAQFAAGGRTATDAARQIRAQIGQDVTKARDDALAAAATQAADLSTAIRGIGRTVNTGAGRRAAERAALTTMTAAQQVGEVVNVAGFGAQRRLRAEREAMVRQGAATEAARVATVGQDVASVGQGATQRQERVRRGASLVADEVGRSSQQLSGAVTTSQQRASEASTRATTEAGRSATAIGQVGDALEGVQRKARDASETQERGSALAAQRAAALSQRISEVGASTEKAASSSRTFALSLVDWARGAIVQRGVNSLIDLAWRGIQKLGDSFVESNARMEQARAAMEAFTGSAAVALRVVTDIRNIGTVRAIDVGELTAGARTLAVVAQGSRKEMVALLQTTQLLAARVPEQGTGGAVRALQEAAGGYYRSVEQRFNIPRATINQLQRQGLFGRELVDEALRQLNVTQEFLDRVAQTFSGRRQILGNFMDEISRRLGEGVFQSINQRLGDFVKVLQQNRDRIFDVASGFGSALGAVFDRIAGFGAKLAGAVGGGLSAAFGNVLTAAEAAGRARRDAQERAMADLDEREAPTTGVVARMQAVGNQPLNYEEGRRSVEEAAGSMRDLNAVSAAANRSLDQVNEQLKALSIPRMQAQRDVERVQYSYERQVKPLQVQLSALNAQKNLQLEQQKLSQGLEEIELRRQRLGIQAVENRRQEAQAALEVNSAQQSLLISELTQPILERMAAGKDPNDERLPVAQRMIALLAQQGRLQIAADKATIEGGTRSRELSSRERELNLQQQITQSQLDEFNLRNEILKLPLEARVAALQAAEEAALRPLQDSLDKLNDENSALELQKAKYEDVLDLIKVKLDSLTARRQVAVDVAVDSDKAVKDADALALRMGNDMMDTIAATVNAWFAGKATGLWGAIGASLGNYLNEPQTTVLFASLGERIGQALVAGIVRVIPQVPAIIGNTIVDAAGLPRSGGAPPAVGPGAPPAVNVAATADAARDAANTLARGSSDRVVAALVRSGATADQVKAMKDAGDAAAYGFIQQLQAHDDEAAEAATGLSQGVVDRVRTNLGISSPSRVMAEIGQQSVDGFLSAFYASDEAVAKAVEAFTTNLTTRVRTATVDPVLPNLDVDLPQLSAKRTPRDFAQVSVSAPVAAGAVQVNGVADQELTDRFSSMQNSMLREFVEYVSARGTTR
jgi:hypothetical protein